MAGQGGQAYLGGCNGAGGDGVILPYCSAPERHGGDLADRSPCCSVQNKAYGT